MTFVLAGLLGACATAVPIVDFYDTDSESLSRCQASESRDDAAVTAGNYRDLGVVEGIYCDRSYGAANLDGPLAKAHVMDQVKLKAAKRGGTYISAPVCKIRTKGDVTNNCTSTVTCKSIALQ